MPSKLEDDWRRFVKLCSQVKSPDELSEFYELFLTIEERDALAKRFLIIEALLKGEQNQRDMAQSIGVSISKITRGSNSLKIVSNKLKKFCQVAMH
ncbi:MAG: trp operon repressor [Sphingomonadales bacterium]